MNPLLGAIATRLSGSREIRLWRDQMIFKPTAVTGSKTSIGWRTDRAYWKTCSQDEANHYQIYRQANGELAWHRNDVLCRMMSGNSDYTDPDFCPVLWRNP